MLACADHRSLDSKIELKCSPPIISPQPSILQCCRESLANATPHYDSLRNSVLVHACALLARMSPSTSVMQAESALRYAGLAVFEAPLKAGSEPALRMLRDSSHLLVMITGDAALTACYTARQVHIVDMPVAILTCDQAGATTSGALCHMYRKHRMRTCTPAAGCAGGAPWRFSNTLRNMSTRLYGSHASS